MDLPFVTIKNSITRQQSGQPTSETTQPNLVRIFGIHRGRGQHKGFACYNREQAEQPNLIVQNQAKQLNLVVKNQYPTRNLPPISFTDEDFRIHNPDQDNPIVVKAVIANWCVHKILIDQGSSTDILYWHTFKKLNLPSNLV